MTICLATIVKDEAGQVERWAATVAPLIDCYRVTDTGSTDGTPDAVRAAFSNWGIPGVVDSIEWDGFGPGLTYAAGRAAAAADWVVRVDPDMTVDVHPGFRDWLDSGASADGYMVPVVDGTLTYRLPLLFRSRSGPWRYMGTTHEYLDVTGKSVPPVDGLTVVHHADGGSRTGKHERDIGLLATDAEQGDPRATFYTAQAYECLGDWETAVNWYDRRAAMTGTWEEERWLAAFRAARLVLDRGDQVDGARRMVDAATSRPDRAEPWAALTAWAETNRPRSQPSADVLFLEPSAYLP